MAKTVIVCDDDILYVYYIDMLCMTYKKLPRLRQLNLQRYRDTLEHLVPVIQRGRCHITIFGKNKSFSLSFLGVSQFVYKFWVYSPEI
jgi:hypothetical protein